MRGDRSRHACTPRGGHPVDHLDISSFSTRPFENNRAQCLGSSSVLIYYTCRYIYIYIYIHIYIYIYIYIYIVLRVKCDRINDFRVRFLETCERACVHFAWSQSQKVYVKERTSAFLHVVKESSRRVVIFSFFLLRTVN